MSNKFFTMKQHTILIIGTLLINNLTGMQATNPKCPSETAKLKAVSMLFRHGDRSPTGSYPLDPYKDYPWPGGPGALSTRGGHQLYQSGMLKYQRYAQLLQVECPDNEICTFDFDQLFVMSSSIERCVHSVNNFLDGFLGINWPSNLVQVPAQSEDEMLSLPGRDCPKYPLQLKTPLTDPIFSRVIDFTSDEGKELLEYLANNTGMHIESNSDLIILEDALLIPHDNGFILPEWSNSVWLQYIQPLSDVVFELMGASGHMKVRSGRLLRDIVNRFQSFYQKSSEQNVLLYSAHDATVAGLLSALGIVNQTVSRPSYASSLNLELYENSVITNDWEIRVIYYRNHASVNPIEIQIPGCPAPCAFKMFVQTVSSKLIDNYDATCEV